MHRVLFIFLTFWRFSEMKNMMKKFLAMFAALAVMVSVVMPCAAGPEGDGPTYELWDEYDIGVRD